MTDIDRMLAVLEKDIEDYLISSVEAIGGECLKLAILGRRGFPDRTVFLTTGVFLVELKRGKDGRLSEQQKYWGRKLERTGNRVYYLWSFDDVDRFIDQATKGSVQ